MKRIPITIAFVNPNKIIIFINPVLSSSARIDICIMMISICVLISLCQIWRTVSKRPMTGLLPVRGDGALQTGLPHVQGRPATEEAGKLRTAGFQERGPAGGKGKKAPEKEKKAPELIHVGGTICGAEDALTVRGDVQGYPCRIVVDTGSNVTIVRPDVLERHGTALPPCIRPTSSLLSTATGETVPVRGKGPLRIRVGGVAITQDTLVADIKDECIVGLDFMLANNYVVEVANGTLRIGEEEVPLYRPVAHVLTSCRRVVAMKNVRIPAQSGATILCDIPSESNGQGWCEIVPAAGRRAPRYLVVKRALVNLRPGGLPVSVVNASDKPISIE